MAHAASEGFPALSIQQPAADLILAGAKRTEYRSRRTSFAGNVLIHASKRINRAAMENKAKLLKRLGCKGVRGAIVGMVDIVNCEKRGPDDFRYRLRNPVQFQKPIPLKGQVGFFRVPTRLLAGTPAAQAKPGRFAHERRALAAGAGR